MLQKIGAGVILLTALLLSGCSNPQPTFTSIEDDDDDTLTEVWGDCRYELVTVPVTDGPEVISNEDMEKLMNGTAAIGWPKTILLNQCSGNTWLFRSEGAWQPMRYLTGPPRTLTPEEFGQLPER